MADQDVRKVFFVGPSPEEMLAVVTMELTCGCKVTREIESDRLKEISEAGYMVKGKVACPEGHDVPASIKGKKFTLIDRALGRSK